MDPRELAATFSDVPMIVAGQLVKKYRAFLSYEEILSEASMGLMQAANNWASYCERNDFDPAAVQYFKVYASRRAKGAVIDALRQVDMGRTARKILKETGQEPPEGKKPPLVTDPQSAKWVELYDDSPLPSDVAVLKMAQIAARKTYLSLPRIQQAVLALYEAASKRDAPSQFYVIAPEDWGIGIHVGYLARDACIQIGHAVVAELDIPVQIREREKIRGTRKTENDLLSCIQALGYSSPSHLIDTYAFWLLEDPLTLVAIMKTAALSHRKRTPVLI